MFGSGREMSRPRSFPKFAAWSDANGNMLTVHIYNPCVPNMSNQSAS
jgi:hypothetical protein